MRHSIGQHLHPWQAWWGSLERRKARFVKYVATTEQCAGEKGRACETRAVPARSMRASMSVSRTVSSVCTRSATLCHAAPAVPHEANTTAEQVDLHAAPTQQHAVHERQPRSPTAGADESRGYHSAQTRSRPASGLLCPGWLPVTPSVQRCSMQRELSRMRACSLAATCVTARSDWRTFSRSSVSWFCRWRTLLSSAPRCCRGKGVSQQLYPICHPCNESSWRPKCRRKAGISKLDATCFAGLPDEARPEHCICRGLCTPRDACWRTQGLPAGWAASW